MMDRQETPELGTTAADRRKGWLPAGSTSNLVYFFPLGFTAQSNDREAVEQWSGELQEVWPARALLRLHPMWQKPALLSDLNLQKYSDPVLDWLIESMPRAVCETGALN